MDERAGRGRGWWRRFRRSPYFAATVLVLLLPVAAAGFAGCYTYAFAAPMPRSVPVALVGVTGDPRGEAVVAGLERALGAPLAVQRAGDYREAMAAVEEQRVFAVLSARGGGYDLAVAGASGASVAQVLTQAAAREAAGSGVEIRVRDVKPLQPGDPRGLALFYITLAVVIVGFSGAVQLGVNAPGLSPGGWIAVTLAYALVAGFAVIAVVSGLLGAVVLPFPRSWLILALTMFVSGMVFTAFNALVGRWAILPTWGLLVVLGNPSAGGFVSGPLLPPALRVIGRWLPPGASISAQHTAVYFPGHQHAMPYLVLAGWAALACAVYLLWRRPPLVGRLPGP